MHRTLRVLLVAGMGVVVWSGRCHAVDQGVSAVKLIVVDKGASGAKAVFVAKDAAVSKGTGMNETTIAVVLDVAYDNGTDAPTAGQFVCPEGSSNWLVNKASVAKYVNKSAPTGGAAKVAVVKPSNLVKLVGKSLGDSPIAILSQGGAASGTAHTSYRITDSATGFDTAFCSTFSGCVWKSIAGGSGAKLVCKPGVADPTCASTTTTTTTLPSPPVELMGALTNTPGRFNYNLTLGLPGANSACSSNFPSTHACTYAELQIAEAAGDLVGLQDTGSNTVTSFWAIDGSQPPLQQCNDSLGSGLNWEYPTADTASRGQKVPLNNPAGTLGAVVSGLQCNFSGGGWVACCL